MIDSYQPKSNIRSVSATLNRSIEPYLNLPQQEFQPSTWVEVLELPSPFCSDTALLLCQESENQWLAWISDYGEIKLSTDQFRKAC